MSDERAPCGNFDPAGKARCFREAASPLTAEIDRLRAENAALKAALSAQDPAISELVRASDAAHGEVVVLEAEVATLKAERTERDGILYREGRAAVAVEVAALKAALGEAERVLQDIASGDLDYGDEPLAVTALHAHGALARIRALREKSDG